MRVNRSAAEPIGTDQAEKNQNAGEASQIEAKAVDVQALSQNSADLGTNLRKSLRRAERGIGEAMIESRLRRRAESARPRATYLGRSSGASAASEAELLKAGALKTTEKSVSSLTMADYKREAEAIIAGAGKNKEARNAAITGAYADMFKRNPLAYKWVGMAAHASFIVGFGIRTGGASPIIGSKIRNMLSEGNSALYSIFYPAFLAYERGGMAELNRLTGSLSGGEFEAFRPIRDAFAKIDEGRKLYEAGQTKKGMEKIWEGNRDMLRHEQLHLVQSIVYDKHPVLASMISPIMYADFDDTDAIDFSTFSAYWKNHAFDSIGEAEERMEWLENDLLPIWRRQNEQQPDLVLKHMETFRNLGKAAGARY